MLDTECGKFLLDSLGLKSDLKRFEKFQSPFLNFTKMKF